MTNTVNEKSPLFITLNFKDEDNLPLVPASVDWRLDNASDGTEIVTWTPIGITMSATMTMSIPSTNNLIVDETEIREPRMFGVRINDGLISEAHEQFKYHVINLKGPTGV